MTGSRVTPHILDTGACGPAAGIATGVRLSDGSTNILPLGTPDEVRSARQLHARLVRSCLERGFHQGWDLHPAAEEKNGQ